MRRPAKTREQRQHDRELRALRALRRAAVRYSIGMEQPKEAAMWPLVFADLEAACDAYRSVIGVRAASKLAR